MKQPQATGTGKRGIPLWVLVVLAVLTAGTLSVGLWFTFDDDKPAGSSKTSGAARNPTAAPAAAKTVGLEITTAPAVAVPLVLHTPDGSIVNESTPYKNEKAPVGRWKVEVPAQGFLPITQEFELSAGAPQQITLRLQPAGRLHLKGQGRFRATDPNGQTFSGTLPWKHEQLNPGLYLFRVTTPDNKVQQYGIPIEGGQRSVVDTTTDPAGNPNALIIADTYIALPSTVAIVTFRSPSGLSYDACPQSKRRGAEGPALQGPRPLGENTVTTLADLRKSVTQVVLRSDGVNDSHDAYKLQCQGNKSSAHFLIDWDGTIYETLDPVAMALDEAHANPASIRIDLNLRHENVLTAKKFKYPYKSVPKMDDPQYERPLPEPLDINGQPVQTYGYTQAQYRSLIELLTVLMKALPGIKPNVPATADNHVLPNVINQDPDAFAGIVAHWHLTGDSWQPGSGFDWQALLDGLKQKGFEAKLTPVDGKP